MQDSLSLDEIVARDREQDLPASATAWGWQCLGLDAMLHEERSKLLVVGGLDLKDRGEFCHRIDMVLACGTLP